MSKPITKALHTARIVGVIAAMVRKANPAVPFTADSLYAATLGVLGNADTTDALLRQQLVAACQSVLS